MADARSDARRACCTRRSTAYERAPSADTTSTALDAAFAPGPGTMRGDGAGLLVGHDAISAFRGARGGVHAAGDRARRAPRTRPTMLRCSSSVSRYDGRRHRAADAGVAARRRALAHHRRARHRRARRRSTGRCGARSATRSTRARGRVRCSDCTSPSRTCSPIKGYRIGAGNPTLLDEARARAPRRAGGRSTCCAAERRCAASPAPTSSRTASPATTRTTAPRPTARVPGALPGGSSSGPASAVATGQAEIGLATDTAGSVRVPASYQGLWGLRTTHGLVPRQGLLPLAQSFDTIGWLTRDGATLQRGRRLVPELRRVGVDRERATASPTPTCRGASSCPTRCSQPVEPDDPRGVRGAPGAAGGRRRIRTRRVSVRPRRVVRAVPHRAGRRGVAQQRRVGHRAPGRRRPRRRRAVRDRRARSPPRRRHPLAARSSRCAERVRSPRRRRRPAHADRARARRRCAPRAPASASTPSAPATLRMTTPWPAIGGAARRCSRPRC